ncbi:MAG: hypothetical protein ACKOS8_10600 [Gemmataceae bacterium]
MTTINKLSAKVLANLSGLLAGCLVHLVILGVFPQWVFLKGVDAPVDIGQGQAILVYAGPVHSIWPWMTYLFGTLVGILVTYWLAVERKRDAVLVTLVLFLVGAIPIMWIWVLLDGCEC